MRLDSMRSVIGGSDAEEPQLTPATAAPSMCLLEPPIMEESAPSAANVGPSAAATVSASGYSSSFPPPLPMLKPHLFN